MNGLIKHTKNLMTNYGVQLLTILVMLAVSAPPAGASHNSVTSPDELLNNVYEDAKGNVETHVMLLAGKKKKGGTRRLLPEIKGSYKEIREMPMAGSPGRPLSDVRAV